jgi:hypothetical protein
MRHASIVAHPAIAGTPEIAKIALTNVLRVIPKAYSKHGLRWRLAKINLGGTYCHLAHAVCASFIRVHREDPFPLGTRTLTTSTSLGL